jgi:hypothetical protein
LIHTSLDLQKLGYVAPKASVTAKSFGWYRYLRYCKKFTKADIKPFSVNSETIDIYLFLRDLVKDTRYQRKLLRYFDSFAIMFPYSYIVPVYFFFVNFYWGVVYLLYTLFVPLYPICFFIIFLKQCYDLLFYFSLIVSDSYDLKLARRRERELRTARLRRYLYSWINWVEANRRKCRLKISKFINKK